MESTLSPFERQEPADPEGSWTRHHPEEADRADRRRVLQLPDGRILRARTRYVDGRWEVRQGPKWIRLTGEVVGWADERALLAESRRRAGQVKREDADARLGLARWQAGAGLHAEALTSLNRILRGAPEHGPTLTWLRTRPLELELEPTAPGPAAEVGALLRKGAVGAPAVRELAVAHVLGYQRRVDLPALVRDELLGHSSPRRAFAAYVARRMGPESLLRELANRSILDPSEAVRLEAARALGDMGDFGLIGPGLRALGSTHATVRGNAAQSLGVMGYSAAVEPLVAHLARRAKAVGGGTAGVRANLFVGLDTAYVSDFDVEIAAGASIAKPVVRSQRSGVVFDVRTTVSITRVVELHQIMGALKQLTGAAVRDDPKAWSQWWTEHGHEWGAMDRARLDQQRAADPED